MLKYLITIIFIIYVLIVSFGSKEGFPDGMRTNNIMPYLSDKPIGEDAYYMLKISENLSNGNGLTYNFGKKTTGIQPLATFIYALIYKIASKIGLSNWYVLRFIILFNAFLLILLTYLIIRIVYLISGEHSNLNWVIPLFTLFNFGLFRIFLYGLETGLYLTMLTLTIYQTLKTDFKIININRLLTLSLLIGLTVLARIDFIVIISIFFLILLIKNLINIKYLIYLGLISFIITLPWFSYVYFITGSFMPSSGSAQSSLTTLSNFFDRLLNMLIALNENLTFWLYTGARKIIAIMGLISLMIFVLFFRNAIKDSINYIKNLQSKWILYSFIISIGALLIVYTLFFWATHFYYRYSSPISIFIIMFFGIVISSYFQNKSNNLKYLFSLLIVILFFSQAYYSLHTGTIGNSHSVTAGFIKNNFPANVKIGAFQSGVIGYFNNNVINLDGKIDYEAYISAKNKVLNKYLDKENINVIVDWPGYIYSNLDSNYLIQNWKKYPKKINNNQSICLIRKN